MRLLALAFTAVLALSGPAFAQSYDAPEDLLADFYAPYLDNNLPENQDAFFSSGLIALYQADAENTPEGEIGALDFDPFVDGQDWSLSDFAIGSADIQGDSATAEVTFDNFNEPRVLTYSLVREDGGWLIEDVLGENGDGSNVYRLSDILQSSQY